MVEAYRFVMENPHILAGWVAEHLLISFVAAFAASVLGISTGIYITGKGREALAEVVLYLAEIMMTVPSLALFGLFMLLLGYLDLSAIGLLPAVITLIVYGQLPILRNTYTAIREVDPDIVEAGKGMGMNERQLLFKIKLPLAVPAIMGGLRNAVVLIIGIAAIAALIGSGGLGVPIFRGLRNARMDLIIVGGVCVSVVAIAVDGLMALFEGMISPKGIGGGEK